MVVRWIGNTCSGHFFSFSSWVAPTGKTAPIRCLVLSSGRVSTVLFFSHFLVRMISTLASVIPSQNCGRHYYQFDMARCEGIHRYRANSLPLRHALNRRERVASLMFPEFIANSHFVTGNDVAHGTIWRGKSQQTPDRLQNTLKTAKERQPLFGPLPLCLRSSQFAPFHAETKNTNL